MKLLLDENIPFTILRHLSLKKIKVKHLLQTHLRGAGDELIFEFAAANKMTIVTFDKDFLEDKFFHQLHYGIIFIRPGDKDINKMAGDIISILKTHRTLKSKTVML